MLFYHVRGITSCKQAYAVCDENILYNIMRVIVGVLWYIILVSSFVTW